MNRLILNLILMAFGLLVSTGVAQAAELNPPVLLSQSFAYNSEAVKIQDMRSGSLTVRLQAHWDWSAEFLEVRLSPTPYRFRVYKIYGSNSFRVETPAGSPEMFSIPEVRAEGDVLILTIFDWDLLRLDTVQVAASVGRLAGSSHSSWVQFAEPLTAFVSYPSTRELPELLGVNSGKTLALEEWMRSVMMATLVDAGDKAFVRLTVNYQYSVGGGPLEQEEVLLLPEAAWQEDLPQAIAQGIRSWIESNSPESNQARLLFDLQIYKETPSESIRPVWRASDLQLDLENVSSL